MPTFKPPAERPPDAVVPPDGSAVFLRVLVASGQPLFLDGLEALLGAEPDTRVVARRGDGPSIARGLEELHPDVGLLDLDLSQADSLRVMRLLHDAVPRLKLIVFTARVDDDVMMDALRLGVRGVLLKSATSAVVIECIREVRAGGYWLESEMTTSAIRKTVTGEATRRHLLREGLTPREAQIMALAGQGLGNSEIGRRLGIRPATVKVHVHQTYRKLGLSDRTALISYIRGRGLS